MNAHFISGRVKGVNTPVAAPPTIRFFRGTLFAFAFVVACHAVWILAAETSRAAISNFPISTQEAAAASKKRHPAILAASLGVIRGDLWADCAITYLNIFWGDERQTGLAQSLDEMRQARRVVHHGLSYAPHDARIWLVLAGIEVKSNLDPRAALQMSYYTGPNEPQLIPLRLILATESYAIDDVEIQQFVRHDIRSIFSHEPHQTQAIEAAYRLATPAGRQFLEKVVLEFDPNFVAGLRSSKPPTK